MSLMTREAVAAVKFIAAHLKEEDDFAEVLLAIALFLRGHYRHHHVFILHTYVVD